jgi:putative membrane protein insertion efficiency factor
MRIVRRVMWRIGAPARSILLGAIWLYRLTLSGWLGGQCRFSPTCSRYAEEAIRSHGAMKGSLLSVRRVLRCNPFGRGGLDPVPRAHSRAATHGPVRGAGRSLPYDTAIHRVTAAEVRDAG